MPAALEIRRGKPMGDEEVAITCMDGFDLVSKARLINGALSGGPVEDGRGPGGRSGVMTRFVAERRKRGLPLSEGKSVIGDYCGLILGGELDGVRGDLQHACDKRQRLLSRSLGIISQEDVSQVMLQHWAGIYCLAASFRRSLFAVGQEILKQITVLDSPEGSWGSCWRQFWTKYLLVHSWPRWRRPTSGPKSALTSR